MLDRTFKRIAGKVRSLAIGFAVMLDSKITHIPLAPEVPVKASDSIGLSECKPSVKDRAIALHVVFDNWSLRRKEDGDFVTPQGVGLVPCIIQIEACPARKKVITGNVTRISPSAVSAITKGADGVTYIVSLGKPLPAYQEFFHMTTLAHPFSEYEDEMATLVGAAA